MSIEDLIQLSESWKPQDGSYPSCDAKIEFETVPIVAAVEEIEDAKVEYKKETKHIREKIKNDDKKKENTYPRNNQEYIDKWITKKEIVILGWEIHDHLVNAWNSYHYPYDSREKYYRLGCLNKSGKLIIDFKYCIIEIVGNYIFAGYEGDYIHNTFQGLYDLYTINGDFLFGGFTQYHLYQKENILACNWGGHWENRFQEGALYEFCACSGYWSLYDLSPLKITLKSGTEWELPYWIKSGGIKSLLPLRDGRDYCIPIKTQISLYDIMACGSIRRMPNLPIETLFIMGNHTIGGYPSISYDILYDIHLFTSEAVRWDLDGEERLFTNECFDYHLSRKELIRNENYKAEDIRLESYLNGYRRHFDDDYISPFDSPYHNDALDMDQQSQDFWDSM